MHTETLKAFERLLYIMDDLREKCPWDKKQTMQSLRNLTLEEVYELADSISENDQKGIKEELGDVMLHLVFYGKIAQEKGDFTLAESLNAICEKLIARHPHIYSDVVVTGEEDVKRNWEQLKLKEGKTSILEGVPKSLPAMIKAFRMQEKTKQVGFEWENPEQVWAKVQEELQELRDEVLAAEQDKSKIEDELGDVFFAMINYARFLGVDPENALERVNKKFKWRFEYIEKNATKPLQDMTLEEMDLLWNQAKGVNKNSDVLKV